MVSFLHHELLQLSRNKGHATVPRGGSRVQVQLQPLRLLHDAIWPLHLKHDAICCSPSLALTVLVGVHRLLRCQLLVLLVLLVLLRLPLLLLLHAPGIAHSSLHCRREVAQENPAVSRPEWLLLVPRTHECNSLVATAACWTQVQLQPLRLLH